MQRNTKYVNQTYYSNILISRFVQSCKCFNALPYTGQNVLCCIDVVQRTCSYVL